jgi:hypothetical protein
MFREVEEHDKWQMKLSAANCGVSKHNKKGRPHFGLPDIARQHSFSKSLPGVIFC